MKTNAFLLFIFMAVTIVIWGKLIRGGKAHKEREKAFATFLSSERVDTVWRGAAASQIPYYSGNGRQIWYGYQLIRNTSYYLGPNGTVSHTTNGMNCGNCHLEGGTLPFALNYGKVYSTYPKFRARSNSVQTIPQRVADCFERSLNGVSPDSSSEEMKAICAYLKWLGEDILKGEERGGTSLQKLSYLSAAASPAKGEIVYVNNCASCHGAAGAGQANAAGRGYTYPPLWGEHSYNDGAGLFRLSNFAAFVKNNMPFGTTYHQPALSDEDAWNVAAFVNSQPRPHREQAHDWKNLAQKPVDFPFGPYADTFPESQHKYGPFAPIAAARKK